MKKASASTPSVWTLLKAAHGDYLSGPALADQLGMSRTAVWKQIRKLKDQGYQIESDPKKGYRILASPDVILPDELEHQLTTRWLGRAYHHLMTTASTNSDALSLALGDAPHGTVVLAEQQTAGRGRLNRKWEAPAGRGLTFSVILRPELPPSSAPQLTLVAGLALAHCIRDRFHVPARIKWPNDILIGSRKTAGILTEMQADSDRIRFVVIGIGINCNQSNQELSGSFRYPATSIAIEQGKVVDRKTFLAALLADLEAYLERMENSGFSSLLKELQDTSEILGSEVVIESMGKTIAGKVEGLTAEGALRIETEAGAHETIWAGDITRMTPGG